MIGDTVPQRSLLFIAKRVETWEQLGDVHDACGQGVDPVLEKE